MAARVAGQECVVEADREIRAGSTVQAMDFIIMVLSVLVACCASVAAVIGWTYRMVESAPVTAASEEILASETLASSEDLEQHTQQQDEPATWHHNDLSSEVVWSLNPLAVGIGAEEFFEEGYGDLTDLPLFEQACEGESDETFFLTTPSTSRKLQPMSVVLEHGPQSPQTSCSDEILLSAPSTSTADLDQQQPATWYDNDLVSDITWQANPLALGMGADEFFEEGYGDLTDLELYEHASEGAFDDHLSVPLTPRMLHLSAPVEDGATRPETSTAEEVLLPAASISAEDLPQEPATWYDNDISSEVTWRLNPLAIDMDVDEFFGLGYGDVSESQLFEDAPEIVSDIASETRPLLTRRKPQLTITIPEGPDGIDGFAVDKHVDVVTPLVAMTPSQVNVRDAASSKLLDFSKIKPSGEEAVPTVDLKEDASEAEKEAARRRAKYEPPFEIWGRTGPNSGLQKWHVTWCPRDATPVGSTPLRQSEEDSRSASAVRVRARQAAAALRHVARRKTSTVRS